MIGTSYLAWRHGNDHMCVSSERMSLWDERSQADLDELAQASSQYAWSSLVPSTLDTEASRARKKLGLEQAVRVRCSLLFDCVIELYGR